MTSVNTNTTAVITTQNVGGEDPPAPVDSRPIAYQFALLQLEQAGLCRLDVDKYMDKIKEDNASRSYINELIAEIRDNRIDGDKMNLDGMPDLKIDDDTTMSFTEFLKKREISLPEKYDADSLEKFAKRLERLGSEIDAESSLDMVYLQDAMGQYNAYSAGASQSLADLFSTNQSISRNLGG